MKLRTQLVLPVLVIVTAFGAFLGAQAKQPAAKGKKLRVYFVEPKNNATVTSPVHMKFGSTGVEISPVPPGDLKETRPGVAHYHVGVGVSCLPAGKNIVKGTPSWVHFGDGKSEIDMQLTPGKHRLALQLGDDLHNTLPGACQMITVTVK
jgi:Domain of unknown function (DUF4399)